MLWISKLIPFLWIDGNRNWVGEPIPTVDWSSIQNIPATITDGDDNTQLSEQEVENYITNDSFCPYIQIQP